MKSDIYLSNDCGGESYAFDHGLVDEPEEQYTPEERVTHLLALIHADWWYSRLGRAVITLNQMRATWAHNDHQDTASHEYQSLCKQARHVESLMDMAAKSNGGQPK